MKLPLAILVVAAFVVVFSARVGWFSSRTAAGLDSRQQTSAESPTVAAKIPSGPGSPRSISHRHPNPRRCLTRAGPSLPRIFRHS